MADASTDRRPASLLARTNLVLGCSALLIALIAALALYYFVIDPISQQSADDEAALLVLSAQTWVELPPEARPYFELEMAEAHDLIISEDLQGLPPVPGAGGYFALLEEKLSERIEQPVTLLAGDELYWVNVPMGGRELQIGFSAEREEIQPLYSAFVIVGLGAAIVFFSSLLIVRRIARPLVKIARQAEEFRGAVEIEPLPETGPRELASLARNFNTMAKEVSVLMENRTTLMAGISHDLRTPLTRMRLALALLPETVDEQLIERFERNLESMDELISDALRFARGTHEPPQEIELGAFVADIVESFEGPVCFKASAPERRLLAAPSALRRVLVNLIENGVKHGGSVEVRLDKAAVLVADDGPGIPASQRDAVFQPFHRLEESRNRATGGSGLGLAIVAQLCQAHGWKVSIEEGPGGGAQARVELSDA